MSDVFSRAQKLFELGAHLGHRKNRLHPRARAFVYQIVDGVSIIDLEKTIPQIDIAKNVIRQAGLDGKVLLICATKKNVSHSAAKLAYDKGLNYVTTKWLPGLFTNFDTITKNVKKLKRLKEDKAMGEWQKFVKHEQVALEKETRKLDRLYGGIASLEKLPDMLFVVDIKRERNAIVEAKKIGIPVVAIVDTNCNPEDVNYPIMINDDTPEAVDHVMNEIFDGYVKKIKEVAQDVKPAAPQVAKVEAPVAQSSAKPAVADKPKAPVKKVEPKEIEKPAKREVAKSEAPAKTAKPVAPEVKPKAEKSKPKKATKKA